MYACMHVCMYACMYACMYVMYVYMYYNHLWLCTVVPCPAEGQSFSSNCRPLNATCSNPSPPSICDLAMCSCPTGQVLDEELNKCVNVSECSK